MIRAAIAAALLLAASGAQGAWRTASSTHFLIYSQDDPKTLREFAEKLERYDSAMRFIRGFDDPPVSPSTRVTVFVVQGVERVRALLTLGKGGNDFVEGFYEPHAGRSFAIVPRKAGSGGGNDLDQQIVLLHEYAHHFMYHYTTGAFPTWVSEGFAEFNASAKFEKDGSVWMGTPAQHRAYGLLLMRGGLDPSRIVTNSYSKLSPEQQESLYGEGWLLTHYLTFEPSRKGQFVKYLAAINKGATPAEAAKVFGDLKTLDRDLRRYVGGKLTAMHIPAAKLKAASVTVSELSPGASAIMDTKIRSQRGVDAKLAKIVAAEMCRRAAPYPDDPFVQRALAEAEYDAGDLDAADAAADRALAADPKMLEAMIYKGRIAVTRAVKAKDSDPKTWRAARAWLTKANRLENDAPEPLMHYYLAYKAERVPPTKNAVAALYQAQGLAPEDSALRIVAARQHLEDEQPDEARALLATIAYDPHGGKAAVWATGILDALGKGGTKAAIAAWDAAKAPDGDDV